MLHAMMQLFLFSAKALILVVLILLLLIGMVAILSKGREKLKGRITIKNLNQKYQAIKETLLAQILSKDQFKKFLKSQKVLDKEKKKNVGTTPQQNIFVLNFVGDMKASAVCSLREEVTAILGIATPKDEVVVLVESAGGMVHAYGLAAAQLSRIREQDIPLTVIVDKIAASGGYLMACIANKIVAAPFAIIGSIGVIVQLPNFHRLLEDKNIDFEQLTAGDYKRTLTLFGKNTEAGREKMQEEIEDVHQLFKAVIHEHRTQVDIEQVATGEHWLGTQALTLKLVDDIKTSDDYLFEKSQVANVYEIQYEIKKSLGSKFGAAASLLKQQFFTAFRPM